MTRLEYVTEAIRRRLQHFDHRRDKGFSEFMARAALEAMRDPQYTQGEQVTVNRDLLTAAVTVPAYVLEAPDDQLWVFMEHPHGRLATGAISTKQIKALRYAVAVNE